MASLPSEALENDLDSHSVGDLRVPPPETLVLLLSDHISDTNSHQTSLPIFIIAVNECPKTLGNVKFIR